MKNFSKVLIVLFLTVMVILPMVSFAVAPPNDDGPAPSTEGNGLVPCGNAGQAECDFGGFMSLIYNITRFVLFDLAIPIAAIMFTYAGFSLVTAGGAEGKTKAKNIFTSTVIGLACSAAAFLIVKLILVTLGFDGGWIGF
jgi:amino acid transporter